MGDYLQLSPPELKFRFELRRNIPVTLTLHNPGTERVAFKVKTTSPKKYCVRPSSGYVDPGASKDIQVIMQAQREYPTSLTDCKDKFLVQSLKISSDVTDISAELFEPGAGKEIKQSKLRVVLLSPPKPPSPVPEGIEEDHSPVKNSLKENGANVAQGGAPQAQGTGIPPAGDPNSELAKIVRERNRLRDQLLKAESDKNDLRKRLDMLDTQQTVETVAKSGRLQLILLPLLALLVGYFISYLI